VAEQTDRPELEGTKKIRRNIWQSMRDEFYRMERMWMTYEIIEQIIYIGTSRG
jgi:hypothetical protein